jgi:hypothetical protein
MKLLNQLNNDYTTKPMPSTGQKKKGNPTTQATLLNLQTDSMHSSSMTKQRACKPGLFHTQMHRLSPKALPSMFTYQDNASDASDVLSGEGKAIGYVAGADGVVDLFDSRTPQRTLEYIPTQERYRQQGRVYVELRFCLTCKQN